MKKIPKKLQKAFDETLDNELGQSFRKMHYNLVGMSTGYKQTQGEFTEVPLPLYYMFARKVFCAVGVTDSRIRFVFTQ
jgi:hypothetical protein